MMKLFAQLIQVVSRAPCGDGRWPRTWRLCILSDGGFKFLAPRRQSCGHRVQLGGNLFAVGKLSAALCVFEREDSRSNWQQRFNLGPLSCGEGLIVFLARNMVGQQQIVGLAFLVQAGKVDCRPTAAASLKRNGSCDRVWQAKMGPCRRWPAYRDRRSSAQSAPAQGLARPADWQAQALRSRLREKLETRIEQDKQRIEKWANALAMSFATIMPCNSDCWRGISFRGSVEDRKMYAIIE
jgi:hypothetical protein